MESFESLPKNYSEYANQVMYFHMKYDAQFVHTIAKFASVHRNTTTRWIIKNMPWLKEKKLLSHIITKEKHHSAWYTANNDGDNKYWCIKLYLEGVFIQRITEYEIYFNITKQRLIAQGTKT